jgi:hypothetical protein
VDAASGIFRLDLLPDPFPHRGEELMTDMDIKRSYVSELYPGARWRRRVRRMPDEQVVAIYLREKNKEIENPPEKPKEKEDDIPF